MAAFDSDAFDTDAFDSDAFDFGSAASTDTDYTPPRFRDAMYRQRLSWGLGVIVLLGAAYIFNVMG